MSGVERKPLDAALIDANKVRALMFRRKSFATSEVAPIFAALDYALAAIRAEQEAIRAEAKRLGVEGGDPIVLMGRLMAYIDARRGNR